MLGAVDVSDAPAPARRHPIVSLSSSTAARSMRTRQPDTAVVVERHAATGPRRAILASSGPMDVQEAFKTYRRDGLVLSCISALFLSAASRHALSSNRVILFDFHCCFFSARRLLITPTRAAIIQFRPCRPSSHDATVIPQPYLIANPQPAPPCASHAAQAATHHWRLIPALRAPACRRFLTASFNLDPLHIATSESHPCTVPRPRFRPGAAKRPPTPLLPLASALSTLPTDRRPCLSSRQVACDST